MDQGFQKDYEIAEDINFVISNPDAVEGLSPSSQKIPFNGHSRTESLGNVGENRLDCKDGSRRGSKVGSILGSLSGSKSGGKLGSQLASPANNCESLKNTIITGRLDSPVPSSEVLKAISRTSSLPVLQEEDEHNHVSFSPNFSRRPSTLAVRGMSRAATPAHGILKTPIQSTPATPIAHSSSKLSNQIDHIDINSERNPGDVATFQESNMQSNLANLNVIGTPVQRLRSRSNSLLQSIAGSKMPSRGHSRLGSPKGAGTPRKSLTDEHLSVEKTLELAADALVEQADVKTATTAATKEADPGKNNASISYGKVKCICFWQRDRFSFVSCSYQHSQVS